MLLPARTVGWSLRKFARCPLLCFMARDARCRISYLLLPSIMQRKLELARFPCSFRVVFCRPSFGRRNEISCTYLLLWKKKKTLITCCSCFFFFCFCWMGLSKWKPRSEEASQRQRSSASERPSDQNTFRADATCITATSKWQGKRSTIIEWEERRGER